MSGTAWLCCGRFVQFRAKRAFCVPVDSTERGFSFSCCAQMNSKSCATHRHLAVHRWTRRTTRDGLPRITTKTLMSCLGSSPKRFTSISIMSTPTVAGPTIWAMKFRTPCVPSASRLVGARTGPLLRRQAVSSGIRSPPPDDSGQGYSEAALRPFVESVPPGSDHEALCGLEWCSWLLRVFCESSGPIGPLPLRLSGRATSAFFRRHLHRAPTSEFLAGCFTRPRQRPHLHSARRCRRQRAHRKRHCRAPL